MRFLPRVVTFVSLAALVGPVGFANAQSTEGPNNPGAISNGGAGDPWTNLSFAAISDDMRASVTTISAPDTLIADDFGFTIPFGATVTGIEVSVERSKDAAAAPPGTESIIIRRAGVELDPIASGAMLPRPPNTDTVATAGGNGSLFGQTWTPGDINDPGFGVSYVLSSGNGTYFVDAITVTVFFTPAETESLCDAVPVIGTARSAFVSDFLDGDADVDGDGLTEEASWALIREVACNGDAPASLQSATETAYNVNLITFDMEAEMASLDGFREVLATYMLISALTEAEVKAALAALDPPITLSGDYVQVTCSGEDCMPQPLVRQSLSEAFLDFETRAANEPYSAEGDLDNDGTNNLTEFMNVEEQAGELSDFVIAATSPDLDGTEPIRNPGGGNGCFIATAAYGSPLADELRVLRGFRDARLLTGSLGAIFVDAYYKSSPPLAEWVSQSDMRGGIVRVALAPIVAMVKAPLTGTVSLMFFGLLGGAALTFRGRRRRRARGR